MVTPSTRSPCRPTELLGIIVSPVGALALLPSRVLWTTCRPPCFALLGFTIFVAAGHLTCQSDPFIALTANYDFTLPPAKRYDARRAA